ncbi:MAG: hypothetical protein KDK36_14220, partial [Leptospiraceae bacterium]|nr:hypothetical protein [Leptospiraceae bacterium]
MKFLKFLILIFLISCNSSSELPDIVNGELDLKNWKLEEKGVLSIKGDWEFYWNELLYPEDFSNGKVDQNKKELLYAPSIWNGKKYKGKDIPGYGYGTYRLKIYFNPEEDRYLSLYTLEQAHSYRIFINGKLRGEKGKVGKSKENFSPDYHTAIYDFTTIDNSVEIIFQISNFSHRVGGLRNDIEIGSHNKLHSYINL